MWKLAFSLISLYNHHTAAVWMVKLWDEVLLQSYSDDRLVCTNLLLLPVQCIGVCEWKISSSVEQSMEEVEREEEEANIKGVCGPDTWRRFVLSQTDTGQKVTNRGWALKGWNKYVVVTELLPYCDRLMQYHQYVVEHILNLPHCWLQTFRRLSHRAPSFQPSFRLACLCAEDKHKT